MESQGMFPKKNAKLFFVWQSDRDSKYCKDFIYDALKNIAEELDNDSDFQYKLILLDSAAGVSGTPEIPDTILRGLSTSDIVIFDFTPVATTDSGTRKSKKLVNQNVAYEFGYSLKAIGDSRLINVSNSYHGSAIKDFFDVRHRLYPINFNVSEVSSDEEYSKERDNLKEELKKRIINIITLHGVYTPPRLHDQYSEWWSSQNRERESTFIQFEGKEFWVDGLVFSPDARLTNSSSMVSRFIESNLEGKKVLDIGTGCGVLAILSALKGAKNVVATDVDSRAIDNARKNVVTYGLESKITLVQTDLFNKIDDKFDLIIANLPIDPKQWKNVTDSVDNLALTFLSEVRSKLAPQGVALLPWASFGNVENILEYLQNHNIQHRHKLEKTFGVFWHLFIIQKDYSAK
jgi:methylase of polypeptide subunit release factors